MPFSNAAAERIFSVLKLVKTQQRNQLHNLTLSSLVYIKDWLKRENKNSSDADFSNDLIKSVLSVSANRSIEPGSRGGASEAPEPVNEETETVTASAS